MTKPHPYRKREPLAQPPRPPEDATLEELDVWRREVWEPWDARRRDRIAGKAFRPRSDPSRAELARAELVDSVVDEMRHRDAERRRRPMSEWAREISMDEIRARHDA